jgi:hypothetical protein
MSLNIPNIDRISKDDPKLGEALAKVQTYTNANVSQTAGNRVAPPPTNPGNPQG